MATSQSERASLLERVAALEGRELPETGATHSNDAGGGVGADLAHSHRVEAAEPAALRVGVGDAGSGGAEAPPSPRAMHGPPPSPMESAISFIAAGMSRTAPVGSPAPLALTRVLSGGEDEGAAARPDGSHTHPAEGPASEQEAAGGDSTTSVSGARGTVAAAAADFEDNASPQESPEAIAAGAAALYEHLLDHFDPAGWSSTHTREVADRLLDLAALLEGSAALAEEDEAAEAEQAAAMDADGLSSADSIEDGGGDARSRRASSVAARRSSAVAAAAALAAAAAATTAAEVDAKVAATP